MHSFSSTHTSTNHTNYAIVSNRLHLDFFFKLSIWHEKIVFSWLTGNKRRPNENTPHATPQLTYASDNINIIDGPNQNAVHLIDMEQEADLNL